MSILVTGGAGYIGSHCVKTLLERGADVAVLDNLVNGHKEAVRGGRFYEGDLADRVFLESVFEQEKVEAVIHFAAYSLVGESVQVPEKYFRNNVGGSLTLLETMKKYQVKTIVFSSTAAVYGEPNYTPIDEEHPCLPTNPYGESKLFVERMMSWFTKAYGLRYAALRYFNVAGADSDGFLGEDHKNETHLIPLVLRAAQKGQPLTVYGRDYPTADGTCIRDYIHVEDLIDAHLLALDYLQKGGPSGSFNLGNGEGFSVQQVIDQARAVTGREIPVADGDRRAGDPAVLVASSRKAMEQLGWKPKHAALSEIIASAWAWHQKFPGGYTRP